MSVWVPVQMPHHGNLPHGIRLRIPQWIYEKAYAEYAKHYGTLNDIAARGGFGLEELLVLLAGKNPYECHDENEFPQATDFFNRYPEERKP